MTRDVGCECTKKEGVKFPNVDAQKSRRPLLLLYLGVVACGSLWNRLAQVVYGTFFFARTLACVRPQAWYSKQVIHRARQIPPTARKSRLA